MKHTTYQRAVQAFEDIIADYLDLEGDEDLAEVVERVRKALKAGYVAAKRAERIQWIYCDDLTFVTRYKGHVCRYRHEREEILRLSRHDTWGFFAKATSIESASRKIRASWRKK